jgi:hypothetical protein
MRIARRDLVETIVHLSFALALLMMPLLTVPSNIKTAEIVIARCRT